MKNADPGPVAALAIAAGASANGAFTAGWMPASPGALLGTGIISLVTGIVLLVITAVGLMRNSIGDDPGVTMFAAPIFGIFALTWLDIGACLIFWQDGMEYALGYLMIFLTLYSLAYVYYSWRLKIPSHVLLFVMVAVGCGASALGNLGLWAIGGMVCGIVFFLLMFVALYVAFKEQLVAVLPPKE